MSKNPHAHDPASTLVAFSLASPGARTVSVAFFFNQWSTDLPTPKPVLATESPSKEHVMVRALVRLEQVEPGQWYCAVPLEPGWYEYLFLVDGQWMMDPEAPEVCPDGLGGFNAARMVEAEAPDNRVSLPSIPVYHDKHAALGRAS